MKKLLLLVLVLGMAGCTSETPNENEEIETPIEDVETPEEETETPVVETPEFSDLTASEILNKMINDSGAEFGGGFETVIDENNMMTYLGSADYPAFKDSAVYAPMMSIDVTLLVVVQAENIEDVDTIVEMMIENIDPHRLICVSFEYEDVAIPHMGDTVALIINPMYKDELAAEFLDIVVGS